MLLAAAGQWNDAIAEAPGLGRAQAGRWRERYAAGDLAAIGCALPRGGRPPKVDAAEVARLTTQTLPEAATHWEPTHPGSEGWRERHDAVRRTQHAGRFAHRLLPSTSPP